MSDTNIDPTQNEAITFDFDTESANIDRPVLVNGTYDATIEATTSGTTKAGAKKLTVRYNLDQMAKSTTGKEVNPGLKLFRDYLLEPVGKMTLDMVKEGIAKLNFAATGKKTITSTADLWNKPVRIQIKVREERAGQNAEGADVTYPASHEIVNVFPRGTVKA